MAATAAVGAGAGGGSVGLLEHGGQRIVVAQVDTVKCCVRSKAAGGLGALVGFDVDEVEDPVSLGGEGLGYSEAYSTGFERGGRGEGERVSATRVFISPFFVFSSNFVLV